MKTRKIVLLIACAALLLICILQSVLKNTGKTKTFDLKETPDEIVITTPAENFKIVRENDAWVVGEKKYPANENSVQDIVDSLSSIRVLESVTSASSETVISQYGLNEGKVVTVEAKKDGKTLRTVKVGKDSTAGSQSYITVDGGKEIYLATGNLGGTMNTKVETLRSRVVYSLPKDSIQSVSLSSADGTEFTLSRTGTAEDFAWYINQPDVSVSADKAKSWFDGLTTASTPQWHDDFVLKGKKLSSATIKTEDKTITLDLYETEDEQSVYFGKCSETPYQFELASYTAQKFQKTVQDLTE